MGRWDNPLHQTCINTLRFLSVDAIEKAKSGHPGLPLGAAPTAYVLWSKHLKHNPQDPKWPDRDRFVLSAGHGSMLLYSLLHLTGYDVSLDDLRQFRQWASRTPGHPEAFMTPGVECTTGPLGQGIGNAVGLAVAERLLAAHFNRPGYEIVGHYTYALCSDGDLMEGVAQEACSLAGHWKLGKLICLYDANDVTLDGPASKCISEDVAARFKAYGWQVIGVKDGNHDLAGIDRAIGRARREAARPSLVIMRTTLGYGAPTKAGKCEAHGAPLGADEATAAKKALGWPLEPEFHVPAEAQAEFRKALGRGKRAQAAWRRQFDRYAGEYPELAAQFKHWQAGELPAGWDADIPVWPAGEKTATREASGKVINYLAGRLPNLVGGDADISSSTRTTISGGGDFDGKNGRNIRYGVREHAMGAIANGLAYHGGIRQFVATFFVFADYMRPPVRLAAMSGLPVIYVWTHDSIGVGEDGPTHQPVEQLASLRAFPNMVVIRPCDANETAEAWRFAIRRTGGPTALILTRQKLPTLDRAAVAPAAGLQKGAYVLKDAGNPQAIIIAAGSEVHVALDAQRLLAAEGVAARVVSMPSWEIFAGQPLEYREAVLPPHLKARVSVEAGVTLGWHRWAGSEGRTIGLDRFGTSAPGEMAMQQFGFTGRNVADTVKELLANR